MEKVFTKQFQYTGMDDYDTAIDQQINEFLESEGVGSDALIDVKYGAQSAMGVITYSALVIYKK